MAKRLVRVRGKVTNIPPIRPETFAEPPTGVTIPPGTTGLVKVTNPEKAGAGTYLGFCAPPTSQSAVRRLALPTDNRAKEVRTYRTTGWLFVCIGAVAGSPTNDLQIEARNPEVLEEVSRWKLPDDLEARFCHALFGATIGGAAGWVMEVGWGNPWLGLLVGMAIGFLLGLLCPTDWGDLLSSLFGAAQVSLLFTLP